MELSAVRCLGFLTGTFSQWMRGHAALAAIIALVVFTLLAVAFVFLARRRPNRLHQRLGLASEVQVSWNGSAGELLHCDGLCRDCSPGGLGIELHESLPVDTHVTLRVPSLSFTGTGVVRHSRRLASGYLVGIGFSRLTRVLAGFATFAPPPQTHFRASNLKPPRNSPATVEPA
jgi:hypothetical protein